MDHIPNPTHLPTTLHPVSTLSRVAPIIALVASGLLWLNGNLTTSSETARKADASAAQIEQLKATQDLQQRQLDQEAATQEQLKALATQVQQTQQGVHDLSTDLHDFESRFYVSPNFRH